MLSRSSLPARGVTTGVVITAGLEGALKLSMGGGGGGGGASGILLADFSRIVVFCSVASFSFSANSCTFLASIFDSSAPTFSLTSVNFPANASFFAPNSLSASTWLPNAC